MTSEVDTTDGFLRPSPTNLQRQSIFDIAQRVAENLGYSNDDNRDIYSSVNKLGGNVFSKDFWLEGSSESGSLEVRSEGDFTIFIPVDTSEARDRFTIAHELGHYVLHFLWPNEVLGKGIRKLRASRYGSDRPEWEANWFASAFLMPNVEFIKLAGKNYSQGQLADHFLVSKKAVEIRAEVLGVDVQP